MTTRVFVPRDAAALSVGANAVAEVFAREAKARGENTRDRAQWLARHVLAGAFGRGRDFAAGAGSPMARSRRATFRPCSTPDS